MALREGIELRFPPVTHVYTSASPYPVRLDAVTIEEAREVIVRICDELAVYRDDLREFRLYLPDLRKLREERLRREMAHEHWRKHGGDT
jgi:hypothetical protein